MTDLNSHFTDFFHNFIHVYSSRAIPGKGQIIRWGKFRATNEGLTTMVICCFRKTALNSDFIWIFL